MKLALVTGATGFLGQHLIHQLLSSESGVRGETRLRLLCRSTSRWDQDPGIELVRGDVTSAADVMRAAEGVNEIYHLAGFVSRRPKHAELLRRTHVEGTRNVCEVALKHGAARLVHVSSSGTIAVGREPVVHNEAAGYQDALVAEWPYYVTKIAAEKLAFGYFEQRQLPVVVVNPSLLLGPGDDRGSSTGDVALFLQDQILALPRGGLNFVDVRDAAAGVVAAMRRGKPGERYLLGGVNWTFREMIERLASITGRRAPRMQPSLGVALLSARLLRTLLPLIGKRFALDDASIKMSALFWYCDSSKARAELDFKPRDPMETLRETVEDIRRRSAAPGR